MQYAQPYGRCPSGWRYFEYHCYRYGDHRNTWLDGRQECRDRGADMVVVESLVEWKFIERMYGNIHTMYGMYRDDTQGR